MNCWGSDLGRGQGPDSNQRAQRKTSCMTGGRAETANINSLVEPAYSTILSRSRRRTRHQSESLSSLPPPLSRPTIIVRNLLLLVMMRTVGSVCDGETYVVAWNANSYSECWLYVWARFRLRCAYTLGDPRRHYFASPVDAQKQRIVRNKNIRAFVS